MTNTITIFKLQLLIWNRLELARRVGHEPQLVSLIRVYKDYYPDVIVGDVTHGRASVFTVCGFTMAVETLN